MRAKKQVRLRALVSGEVVSTSEKFEDGARVSRGDVLVRIDKFVYETRLDEARAALKVPEHCWRERAASAELAEQDFKRAQQLFKKGTVSKKCWMTAKPILPSKPRAKTNSNQPLTGTRFRSKGHSGT